MFNDLSWQRILQVAIVIFALVLVPTVIIPAAAELITDGIKWGGETFVDAIRPFSRSGDARLSGLVRLCLYLIFFTLVAKMFFGRRP